MSDETGPRDRLAGATAVDHQGSSYVLGRGEDAYCIWPIEGGSPVRSFPMTPEGWTEAWRVWEAFEGRVDAGGLQPRRAGQILDEAIRHYRANARTLIPLVAVLIVPVVLLDYLLLQTMVETVLVSGTAVFASEADLNTAVLLGFVWLGLWFLFVTPLLTGAVVVVGAHSYLGEKTTVGAALRTALPKMLPLLLVSLLTMLAAAIGMIALIIPGLLIFARLVFAPAVVMLEDLRGTKALGRSWDLGVGRSWRILGVILLAGLLSSIGSAIIGLPLQIAGQAMGGLASTGWVLSALGDVLAQVIVAPFSTLVIVLLYFDARVRREGFDLQRMAAQVGNDSPADA